MSAMHGDVLPPSSAVRDTTRTRFDAAFFGAVNRFVEPAVRAGLGSPGLAPTGLVVLETTGRASGLTRRVPLVGTLVGRLLVVATLRVDQSQWLGNVRQDPTVRYWLFGQPYRARAVTIMPGGDALAVDDLDARALAALLRAPATLFGLAFVILVRDAD